MSEASHQTEPSPMTAPSSVAPAAPMRFSSRPVMWGDKQRFEMIDATSGRVVAIWGSREIADNMVTWSNVRELRARRVAAAAAPAAPAPAVDTPGL